MLIYSGYDIETAKLYAFNECYRVFRGGRPDLAGAVYLKDTIYLTANIDIWNSLINNILSYDEFVDLIEGRRVVLK